MLKKLITNLLKLAKVDKKRRARTQSTKHLLISSNSNKIENTAKTWFASYQNINKRSTKIVFKVTKINKKRNIWIKLAMINKILTNMNSITDWNQPKLSKSDFDKNRIEVYKTIKLDRNRLSTKTNGLKIGQKSQHWIIIDNKQSWIM